MFKDIATTVFQEMGPEGMSVLQGMIVTGVVGLGKRIFGSKWDEWGPSIRYGAVVVAAIVVAVVPGVLAGAGTAVIVKMALGAFLSSIGFRQVLKHKKDVQSDLSKKISRPVSLVTRVDLAGSRKRAESAKVVNIKDSSEDSKDLPN